MPDSDTSRLWDIGHPYVCEEGCYYEKNGETANACDSWEEFLESPANGDPDLNLLYRWDWYSDDKSGEEHLMLFFVLQRKAYNISYDVTVTREDEPAIREWLTKRLETIKTLWAPLL